MKWSKRIFIGLMGFLVGFGALGVWSYLNWTSLNSAVIAGAGTAVLFGAGFAAPENTPKGMRVSAIALLILAASAFCFYVYGILRVSDCGFIDERLYCLHRYF